MLRGYRLVLVAAFGWLSLVAAAPESGGKTKSNQSAPQSAASDQLNRIATALEKPKTSQTPDRGCQSGKEDRSSDLCAQWKAADAAADSAYWTWATFIVTIVGLLIGAATLTAAAFAALYAKRAAEETKRSADAADAGHKAFISAERAIIVVTGGVCESADSESYYFLQVNVCNVGKSAASIKSVTVSIRDKSEFSGMWGHEVPRPLIVPAGNEARIDLISIEIVKRFPHFAVIKVTYDAMHGLQRDAYGSLEIEALRGPEGMYLRASPTNIFGTPYST